MHIAPQDISTAMTSLHEIISQQVWLPISHEAKPRTTQHAKYIFWHELPCCSRTNHIEKAVFSQPQICLPWNWEWKREGRFGRSTSETIGMPRCRNLQSNNDWYSDHQDLHCIWLTGSRTQLLEINALSINVFMQIYIYMYTHTRIYTYMHIYLYIYIHT